MKKYGLVALATLFMFSVPVLGQEHMPPRGERGHRKEFKQKERPQLSPEKRAERMAKQLQLTDAEKAKVLTFMQKQDEKMKQHFDEMKKLREEQKAKFESERKAHDDELQSIIGKEKFEKLQTMRAKQIHKLRERRGGAPNDSTWVKKDGPKRFKKMDKANPEK